LPNARQDHASPIVLGIDTRSKKETGEIGWRQTIIINDKA